MTAITPWIRATYPHNGAEDVPEDTGISISFACNINRNTLNNRNIIILDGNQGGKLISDRFVLHYDADTMTLHISLKAGEEKLGPRNTVEVIVTGRVANYSNEQLGMPFHLRFVTA